MYNSKFLQTHSEETSCARCSGCWGVGAGAGHFREEENASPAVQGPAGRSGRTGPETAGQGSVICNSTWLSSWARGAPTEGGVVSIL